MNPRPPVECLEERCSKTATLRRSMSKMWKKSFQKDCDPRRSSVSFCQRRTKVVLRARISCQDGAGTATTSRSATRTSRTIGGQADRTLDLRRRGACVEDSNKPCTAPLSSADQLLTPWEARRQTLIMDPTSICTG